MKKLAIVYNNPDNREAMTHIEQEIEEVFCRNVHLQPYFFNQLQPGDKILADAILRGTDLPLEDRVMVVSAISHQLRVLKQAGLVRSEKQGKVVYYMLSDNHVNTVFNNAIEHIME